MLNKMETKNPTEEYLNELRRIVSLPNVKNLDAGIKISSYSNKEENGYGGYNEISGDIFLTHNGLKEIEKRSEYIHKAHMLADREYSKNHEISLNNISMEDFEAIIIKYSITKEKLIELRNKLETIVVIT